MTPEQLKHALDIIRLELDAIEKAFLSQKTDFVPEVLSPSDEPE